jgi:hypothetical protein
MHTAQGIAVTLLLIVCFVIVMIPAPATGEPSGDALTRGGRFTINITGLPGTPYYVWLTRTSSMTGKPGDQPPVIVAFQSGIQKNPPEGPYLIGSYVINNGNGRTIRDDIAPSTPEISNTDYYALVTTDADGHAVVAFQTSSGTAIKTFSVKVENHQSAANSDILIEGGAANKNPGYSGTRISVIPQELTNSMAEKITESSLPATIGLTMIPVQIQTPSQQSAPGYGFCIIAVITGILMGGRKKFFR